MIYIIAIMLILSGLAFEVGYKLKASDPMTWRPIYGSVMFKFFAWLLTWALIIAGIFLILNGFANLMNHSPNYINL